MQNKIRSDALHENVMAIGALKDILKSSLGPNARSKLIVDPHKRVTVSQDGAFLLKQLNVQQAAASILVEAVLSLDKFIGDGTTSTALLACSLIEQAYAKHRKENYPMKYILQGYDWCLEFIKSEIIPKASIVVEEDFENNRKKNIFNIVNSALSSKTAVHIHAKYLATLLTNSILSVMDGNTFDIQNIMLLKIPGLFGTTECLPKTVIVPTTSVTSTEVLTKRESPYKLLVIHGPLQRQRTKTKHYAILDTVENLEKWKVEEEMVFKRMAETIKSIHANIVICKGVVHDLVSHYLQSFGILCLENVPSELCKFTCKTLNIQYVQSIEELQNECREMIDLDEKSNKISQKYLGLVESCELYQMNGDLSHQQVLSTIIKAWNDQKYQIEKPTTCTTIIRGSTMEQCEEFVRHAQDALYTCMVTLTECNKKMSKQTICERAESNDAQHDLMASRSQQIFVTGGGSFELYCMWQLEQWLLHGKQDQPLLEAAGIECFVKALRVIPETLCVNANFPPEQTIRQTIRKQKDSQCSYFGIPACHVIDLDQFDALLQNPSSFMHQDNMLQMEIYDSIFTKQATLETSIEVAKNILMVSGIILYNHQSANQ
ncbi:hypothetical protein C9374_000299 [Naegleria lovaniensis]|uniref:Uncharacterized protein n=1 Tax=Naegleria lovaniensis TaxID=51637 RepID=A0AA88GXJ2_NAELO|nr:uncharacterized protein C9374_000299 [Naegleria lovaniensis]KAG2388860.1 hypothetical protein C9374_000299 [Naegleria lovaniensis]